MQHFITTNDNPQTVVDNANSGDLVTFLPGLHEHGINNNGQTKNSIVYIDKPLNVELMAGAILRLADDSIPLNTHGEITTNQGPAKLLDDMSIGASTNYTLTHETDYYIKIDGTGSPNTFEYGIFTPGPIWTPVQTGIPITGAEQAIQDGLFIKFDNLTGHNIGSIWYVSFDGLAHYGIRVGHGRQVDYIEDVTIYGQGTVDLNIHNNLQSSFLVADIPSAVLGHGRVRNLKVLDITMKNCHRPFMAYGDHSGTYLAGGATSGGESFDMERVDCLRTTILNDSPLSAGILLGHPSYRGKLTDVRVNDNYIQVGTTPIEPNFNLDQYTIFRNAIAAASKPAAIHCWRKSTNGVIMGNTLIGDPTNKPMVMQHAPGGWDLPENIIDLDNFNLLTTYVPPIEGVEPCNCPPANNLPTLNLALYMRFNGNLTDSTGKNNGITSKGTSFVDGIYGSEKAIFVNNISDSKVTIPHNADFNFVDANGDLPWSFTTSLSSKASLGRYLLAKGDGANYEYQVIQGHNTKKVRVRLIDLNNGGFLFVEGSTVLQAKDVITVTYSGNGDVSGIKIYVNKVEVSSYTDMSSGTYVSMTATNEDLHIGGSGSNSQPGANADFQGSGLWDIELNQSQIDELTDILTNGDDIL